MTTTSIQCVQCGEEKKRIREERLECIHYGILGVRLGVYKRHRYRPLTDRELREGNDILTKFVLKD